MQWTQITSYMGQTNVIVTYTKSTFKLGPKTIKTPKHEILLVSNKILDSRGKFPLGFESKARHNGRTTI